MLHIIFLLLTVPITIKGISSCSTEPSQVKYHLMEKCYRSKLGIAVRTNSTSLASCQRIGIEKRGLAINWSPPEARSDGEVVSTCEVLQCAETDGGVSLVNDTSYDYYSLYAKPLPHVNSSCVPATGMFLLVRSELNYSQASQECRNVTAVPADVATEQRTETLAQLLAGSGVDAAFVGLRSKNGSAFVTTKGDSLDCTTYRAWAPGHPRRYRNDFDCVLLTRRKTWMSAPCKKKYPVLCELMPGGPYKRGSIFVLRHQNATIEEEIPKDE